MMKEICGQCLQPLTDPQTGETRIVFTCFNQDLPLDEVDFPALAQRLGQNSLAEKLTRAWIDRCLRHLGKRGAPGRPAPRPGANPPASPETACSADARRKRPGVCALNPAPFRPGKDTPLDFQERKSPFKG